MINNHGYIMIRGVYAHLGRRNELRVGWKQHISSFPVNSVAKEHHRVFWVLKHIDAFVEFKGTVEAAEKLKEFFKLLGVLDLEESLYVKILELLNRMF